MNFEDLRTANRLRLPHFKNRRGDYGDDVELGIGELLDELADVVIYADLCAQQIHRRLEIGVANKFNEVSDRIGYAGKLEAA